MKLSIQAKATIGITLLVLLLLAASGWFYLYTASKALDAEMGQRLIAIAKASAAQMKWEYLRLFKPGSEGRLYRGIQQELQSMSAATGARSIYIFDLMGKSLVDSRSDVPIGTQYRTLDADRVHVDQAKMGTATVSTAFHGKDDAFYKSAYAPILDSGEVVAILAVDASVLFLEILESMRRNMILVAVVGMIIAILLSALFARSITVPIKRLSHAARQIKEGELGTQVQEYSKDEVGTLAETFNEMSIAISERDKRLSRLNEELRQMSAGLAHEVRNPLNGIRIFLELTKRQCAGDTEAERMIEKADAEVQALNKVVTEFLDFARPAQLQRTEVNLYEEIKAILALLGPELDSNGIQIKESDLDELPSVQADAEQLRRVFTNIVKNAQQSMPHGGTLTISGKAILQEEVIRIEFEDTGTGITQDAIERIFDPFFTTRDTGIGLGLAVVKRILENHSGSIECRSEEERGTTFTIILPTELPKGEGREPNIGR
jgi:signal transduction histidine kinase